MMILPDQVKMQDYDRSNTDENVKFIFGHIVTPSQQAKGLKSKLDYCTVWLVGTHPFILLVLFTYQEIANLLLFSGIT